MALTNAEKVRAHRARKKAQEKIRAKQAERVSIFEHPRIPFYRWYEGASDFQMCLDIAGIEAPEIEDDSDPKSATGEIELLFENNPEESPYFEAKGSLARAEIMVGALLSATVELADLINRYKREEISNRIKTIEASDLTQPNNREQAFTEVVRLKKMLDQLDKNVRWAFPQWKVSEE